MVTQKKVAEHLDLSDRRVRGLIKEGVLPPSRGPGGYNLDDSRVAYIRHLRGLASGQVKSEENLDLQKERARLLNSQTEKTDLQIEEMRRHLVSVDDVAAVWQRLISAMKVKLLSLPTKSAALVMSSDSQSEIKAILKDQVHGALTELHSDLSSIIDKQSERDS